MKAKRNSRIVSNPKILSGKPVISGTRLSVEFILELLSSGWTYEQIVKDYKIKKDDISAALDFAKDTLREVKIVPLHS